MYGNLRYSGCEKHPRGTVCWGFSREVTGYIRDFDNVRALGKNLKWNFTDIQISSCTRIEIVFIFKKTRLLPNEIISFSISSRWVIKYSWENLNFWSVSSFSRRCLVCARRKTSEEYFIHFYQISTFPRLLFFLFFSDDCETTPITEFELRLRTMSG